MDFSMLHQRDDIGPGPYPDVTTIPTPPLQAAALAIIFTLPSIAIVVFSLRVYIRVSMRMVGLVFKLNYYGWRDEEVPEDWDPSAGLWWNFFYQMCYNPVLALVKCSILVFLLRLGGHHKAVSTVIYAIMAFVIGHAIAVFFTALFQCVPIRTNWTPALREDPDTRCVDNSFHIIQSALNILSDILVLAVPFWIFIQLRMPRGAKWAVLGVFAIGCLVPIVAIIRLVNMYRLLYLGESVRHHNIAYVWTAVEINLAVICCSMPALRPLLARWFPRVFGNISGNSSGPQGASGNIYLAGTKHSTSHGPSSKNYTLRDLHPSRASRHPTNRTEIRGDSPTGSEEEIMTYNGILRTTDFNVRYENAKRGDDESNVSSASEVPVEREMK